MAQLMVRNVDEAFVPKKRAARHNLSAEQEDREVLEQALMRPRRRSLAEVLAGCQTPGKAPISSANLGTEWTGRGKLC